MWDEEINKKIKDAADQYHPAYDDNAWNKMEQMLDEHLPRKKDRRIFIYFLPLMLLFLGGGIFFMIFRKGPIPSSKISEKPLSKSSLEKSRISASPVPVTPGKNFGKILDRGSRQLKETSVIAANPGTKNTDKPFTHGKVNKVNKNAGAISKDLLPGDGMKQSEDRSLSNDVNAKRNPVKNNSTNETKDPTGKPSNEEIISPVVANNDSRVSKVNPATVKEDKETVKPKDVVKAENPKKDEIRNTQQKKTKKSFIQNFGIGLSAGPDVSAVKLSNAGKMTFIYGGELSYSFTRKFTLRTGFYVARKIYSVDDNEYHVPAGSTWNNFLQSVDANCKVYEIPLTISYNFGKTKNHNWFASTGLSSYFMKRESYVYYYKNPAGVTWDKPKTITNQNKHYFSVLDISAGYEYYINKRFSLSAEPYVKLPLSGIGLGKIKLNSAGVLFTVAVKPF
ncbi:MAG: outer membrane beta-barrel protein [Ginsengibacter sp.]